MHVFKSIIVSYFFELIILINTERNLRETRAIAAIKNNPQYFYKFVKNNSKIRAGIGPLQDEEGNLEPSNKKMSELLNEQYNIVFSTPDPTMTIKYPKDFFGHIQGNTLLDINITREELVAVGQNLRSISSQAGLQLLNVLVTLTLIGHSTTTQTTGEYEQRSVIDTVSLRFLCWDPCSLTSLHAPQVRALTTYTTVAMKCRHHL